MNATIVCQMFNDERCVIVADKIAYVTKGLHGADVHLINGETVFTAEPVKVVEARIDSALDRGP